MEAGHLDLEPTVGMCSSSSPQHDFAQDDQADVSRWYQGPGKIVSNPADPAHSDLWRYHIDQDDAHRGPETPAKAPTAAEHSAAESALQAAADIVQNERDTSIAGAPAEYREALHSLYRAARGRDAGAVLAGAQRLRALESALDALRPAIALVDVDAHDWVKEELLDYIPRLRHDLRYVEAKDRVETSVRLDADHVVERPDQCTQREQGKLLQCEIPKLVSALALVNEQIVRANHEGIEAEAEALIEGELVPVKYRRLGARSLVQLQNLLFMADAWLMLSDEELPHHLHEINGFLDGVATFSELLKAVVELAAGAVGVTAAFAAAIAKIGGEAELFASASGLAKATGLKLGNVIACIEVAHALVVLLDSNTTRQQKMDAAVEGAAGTGWLASRFLRGFETEAADAAADAVAAGSLAVTLGYGELQVALDLYWGASVGLTTGLMGAALETLRRDGRAIARNADALMRAALLLETERDPEKRQALDELQLNIARQLGESVDSLIEDCGPKGFEAGVANEPGAFEILREAFAPLSRFKGARSVEEAATAGKVALERLHWVMVHAAELVLASAQHDTLSDVEAELSHVVPEQVESRMNR